MLTRATGEPGKEPFRARGLPFLNTPGPDLLVGLSGSLHARATNPAIVGCAKDLRETFRKFTTELNLREIDPTKVT